MELNIIKNTHAYKCTLFLNYWDNDDMANSSRCELFGDSEDSIRSQVTYLNAAVLELYNLRNSRPAGDRPRFTAMREEIKTRSGVVGEDDLIKENIKKILEIAIKSEVLDAWRHPLFSSEANICDYGVDN